MKIVIVATSIIPGNSLGIENFTYRLLNSLTDIYPSDIFYVLIPYDTTEQWKQRLSPHSNLILTPVRLSPRVFDHVRSSATNLSAGLYQGLKKSFLARMAFRLVRCLDLQLRLRKIKPDVVYSSYHLEMLCGGKGKMVVTVHDLREAMREFYDVEKAPILQRNVEKARAVIVAWKHPFDQLKDMFPETRDKAHLIPFPIPISPNGLQPEVQSRNEILLFASALRPQKNHVNLVHALRIVVDERQKIGKSVCLVCAGTKHSPTYEEVFREVQGLGLEEHVEFTGFVSDDALKDLYAQANIIVTPTLWEAASGAIFEAFLFEKPVACSRIAPIVSQVEQSGAIVSYFDPNDPQDIARSILEVLESPALYITGSKRGAQFVRSLSWAKTAQEYMQVFRQVAHSK